MATATAPQKGLTFIETANAISSFLEIALHTLLCIRQVYPPSTFTRKRAYGVPVYESRHPGVQNYIANVVKALNVELGNGTLKRMTVVVKRSDNGLVLERFLFDVGFMDLNALREVGGWNTQLYNAPDQEELSLLLRAFLVRLMGLDTQLEDLKQETTFAIVIETEDGKEPASNSKPELESPWAPALATDVMLPPRTDSLEPPAVAAPTAPAPTPQPEHAPLLFVKAVDTGVIDVSLLVQEHVTKLSSAK